LYDKCVSEAEGGTDMPRMMAGLALFSAMVALRCAVESICSFLLITTEVGMRLTTSSSAGTNEREKEHSNTDYEISATVSYEDEDYDHRPASSNMEEDLEEGEIFEFIKG